MAQCKSTCTIVKSYNELLAMGCSTSTSADIPVDRPSSILTPEVKGAPTAKQWYHADITNNEAEERLRYAAEEDGNYLVYDFYNEAGPVHGEYMLLVYYNEGKVYRRKISRRRNGRFILGEDKTAMVESYASVRKLIKAHRGKNGKPLARLADGRLVKLTPEYIRPIVTDSHNPGIPATRPRFQRRQRRYSDTFKPERHTTKKIIRRRLNTTS